MSAIILIPARGGSKRVYNKNLRKLGGIPLVAHSIKTGLDMNLPTYISTESHEIARVATEYGARVIARPPDLATDAAGDDGVIRDALSVVPTDLVIYLRPTTPFRELDRVQDALRLMSVTGYDSLRSVEEMSESAFKCFKIRAGLLQPLTRTDYTDRPNQELPRTFHPNGYVDILRRSVVDSGGIWGAGRYAFITPRTVEIDTEEDFEYAKYYIERRN